MGEDLQAEAQGSTSSLSAKGLHEKNVEYLQQNFRIWHRRQAERGGGGEEERGESTSPSRTLANSNKQNRYKISLENLYQQKKWRTDVPVYNSMSYNSILSIKATGQGEGSEKDKRFTVMRNIELVERVEEETEVPLDTSKGPLININIKNVINIFNI